VDTSFVIFNNAPPKFLLEEMILDLMTPAPCFEAETSSKCFMELQTLCPPGSLRARLSFFEAVQILQQNSFNEVTSSALLQLDSVNLFGILAG
jgi:hypothetical protein